MHQDSTRINLPIGDSAIGVVAGSKPLRNADLLILAELVSLGAFKSVRSINLQNQLGYGPDGHQVKSVEVTAQPTFHGDGFGVAGLSAFMEVARLDRGLPALERMNLSMNKIGDDGLTTDWQIASALAAGAFPQLVEIKLYRNEFGDAGIQALAHAFATPHATLRNVYLGMTPKKRASLDPGSKAALEAAGCVLTETDTLANQAGCAVHLAAIGPSMIHHSFTDMVLPGSVP